MELWGATDSGKVRQQNQDVFKTISDVDRNVAVLVVCDGMGGARAGSVASALAADTFIRYMEEHIDKITSQRKISEVVSDAVLCANKAVYDQGSHEEDYAGMGTTLAAAISSPSGEVVVNIGDSRVYHVRTCGITQVTRDHSVVEDLIIRGDLTRAEARRHPKKHLITRALGTSDEEKPDLFFLGLKQGEYLLLCSDGLSNLVLDSEMQFELLRGENVRESCENLVAMALSRGAPDNVTAVIYQK